MAPKKATRPVHAVLFDIDDTLVDLQSAMSTTLERVSGPHLPHLGDQEWVEFKRLFWADPQGYYDMFLAGEVSFIEQRILRARHVHSLFGASQLDDEGFGRWNDEYQRQLPQHWGAFDDVAGILDLLDVSGIPYGAVSNNTEEYQRIKLDGCGLKRIHILVGTDTVGVPKPDPAIFHEGARRLGTDPAHTVYVGDNRLVDAEGATAAGLQAVWLNRTGIDVGSFEGPEIATLDELAAFIDIDGK